MTQDFAPDLARARTNMVENQVRVNDVTDLGVQDAMRVVPRERFCGQKAHLAYVEAQVEYAAPGWKLAEPREIAKLLQAITPRPGETALAIAAPYAAAVLARIGCVVTALQPDGAALDAVKPALEEAGVAVTGAERLNDLGDLGPFDLMICEGAVDRAPEGWTGRLAEGGRLAVVERSGPNGRARLYVRAADGGLSRRDVFDATPSLMPGFGPKAAFAL